MSEQFDKDKYEHSSYSQEVGEIYGGVVANKIEGNLNYYATSPQERSSNEIKLLQSIASEVEDRLERSLHNEVYLKLHKELRPKEVVRPWDITVKVGKSPNKLLSKNTKISEVFDWEKIGGHLLILGEPGAGKTTTLLELAEELVARAKEQSNHPIPVWIELSSWIDKKQSIHDWLIEELKSKYGVPKALGDLWLKEKKLIPLLDGLDELRAELQKPCAHALNIFLSGVTAPLHLVVCSRLEEYQQLKLLLNLRGALYLKPLTYEQIERYMLSSDQISLLNSTQQDQHLLELVRTPFMLSVITLIYEDIDLKQLETLESPKDRLGLILDGYIGNRLQDKTGPYSQREIRLWLSWIAKNLEKEFQTEFLIEKIQPSWLTSSIRKKYSWRSKIGVVFLVMLFSIFSSLILYGLLLRPILTIYGFKNNEFLLGLWSALSQGFYLGIGYGSICLAPDIFLTLTRFLPSQTIVRKFISRKLILKFCLLVFCGAFFAISILITDSFHWAINYLSNGAHFNLFEYLDGWSLKSSDFQEKLYSRIIYPGLVCSSSVLFLKDWNIDTDIIKIVDENSWSFRKISIIHSIRSWLMISFKPIFYIYLIYNIATVSVAYCNYSPNTFSFHCLFDAALNTIFYLAASLPSLVWMIGFCLVHTPLVAISIWILVIFPKEVIEGAANLEIENKIVPNQGIKNSFKNGIIQSLRLGILLGGLAIAIFSIIYFSLNYHELLISEETYFQVSSTPNPFVSIFTFALHNSIFFGTFFGSLAGMQGGWKACIQHFYLRYDIFQNGFGPWDYAHFLYYCSKIGLIQRVGGRYRFIHKLIQGHFAAMPFERPLR